MIILQMCNITRYLKIINAVVWKRIIMCFLIASIIFQYFNEYLHFRSINFYWHFSSCRLGKKCIVSANLLMLSDAALENIVRQMAEQ